jgi:multidrug resistance efflux pump
MTAPSHLPSGQRRTGSRLGARALLRSPLAVASTVITVLVILAAYYILANRLTPYTDDTYVQAYVVQIAPQVAGRVTRVAVVDNSRVKKDSLLFEIDPRPYQYKVDQLRAELAQATEQVKALKENRDAAAVAVQDRTTQRQFAQQRFDELNKLERSGSATRFSLEDVTNTLNNAIDGLREAQTKLHTAAAQLNAVVNGEHALVHRAKAALAAADLQLAETKVEAPSDGIVTNLQLSVGAYVNIGTQVMTLIDTSEWRMVANFPENALSRIAPGQPAELTLSMYPGRVFEGSVESVNWGVSTGQGLPSGQLPAVATPQNWMTPSQRFPVRLRFDRRQHDLRLRVGATGIVTVYTGGGPLMAGLAHFWMKLRSLLAYLY